MKIKFIGVILFCSLNMFGAHEENPGSQVGRVEDGKEGQNDGPSENPFDAARRGRSWSIGKWVAEINVPDGHGRTPVFHAKDGPAVVACAAAGADLGVIDEDGNSPLVWGVKQKNISYVRGVLDTKSFVASVRDNPDNRMASGFYALCRKVPFFGVSYQTRTANLLAIRQFMQTGDPKDEQLVGLFAEYNASQHNELAAQEMYQVARSKKRE